MFSQSGRPALTRYGRSDSKLVQDYVHVDGHWLCIDDEQLPLSESIGRIVVLGVGKAGAGMAAGFGTGSGTAGRP